MATLLDQEHSEGAARAPAPQPSPAPPSSETSATRPAQRRERPTQQRFALFGGLGLAVALIAALVVLFSWTRSTVVEVSAKTWERSVAIERYQAVDEGEWCDHLPRSAEVFSRERRERSTKKVPAGEECSIRKKDQGDGTYKELRECQPKYRSEAVYGEYCRFKINRWREIRTVKSSGDTQAPLATWPEVTLEKTGECLDCEREGKRKARYAVSFREPKSDETLNCDFDEAQWLRFKPTEKLKANVRRMGGLDCSSISAVR